MLLANASSGTETSESATTGQVTSNIQAVAITDNILASNLGSHETSSRANKECSLENRLFLKALFDAMNCPENDYLPLFSLSLLYAIQKNEGVELQKPE